MDYRTAKKHYATIGQTTLSDIILYYDLNAAKSVSNRIKGTAVILGESHAIVTSLRAAEHLAKAGYQYA